MFCRRVTEDVNITVLAAQDAICVQRGAESRDRVGTASDDGRVSTPQHAGVADFCHSVISAHVLCSMADGLLEELLSDCAEEFGVVTDALVTSVCVKEFGIDDPRHT